MLRSFGIGISEGISQAFNGLSNLFGGSNSGGSGRGYDPSNGVGTLYTQGDAPNGTKVAGAGYDENDNKVVVYYDRNGTITTKKRDWDFIDSGGGSNSDTTLTRSGGQFDHYETNAAGERVAVLTPFIVKAPNNAGSEYDFVNGVKVIGANRGLKVGQMGIGSLQDARDALYALGKDPTQSWPKQRAVYAIRALDNAAEVKRHALTLGVGGLSMNLILGAATPGFRSGIGGGFTSEAVNTTYEGRLITVIGSQRDVARGGYHVMDGFNTLRVGNFDFMSSQAFDAINQNFMRIAIERGDDFWLVTNPAAHRALSQQYNFQSRFLDLEIPMLEVGRGVTIPTR